MPPAALNVSLVLAALTAGSLISVGLPGAFAAGDALRPEGVEIHRVLVVPVNLHGRVPLAVDRKQIVRALDGDQEWWPPATGRVPTGNWNSLGPKDDVVDPVTLSEPADFCGSGLRRLASEVRGGIAAPRGAARQRYQHIVFVIPKDAPCWWTGLGDIGGKRVWVKATTAKALQHELGHNLGMNHAVRWRSPEAEGSDFMGSGGTGLNAPHIVQMGWLRDYPGKVVELTGPADVTLEALEADPRKSSLPKVAIVRPAADANAYYLPTALLLLPVQCRKNLHAA